MEVYVEYVLGIGKSLDNIKKFISEFRDLVDGVDIPESSLGYPSVNSVALAAILINLFNVKSIAHIRLADLNHVGFLSLASAAEALGVKYLLVTVGDPPVLGRNVDQLTSEEALDIAREYGIKKLKIGAILSMRFPIEKIFERLDRGFDFYLVLRLSSENLDKFIKVSRKAHDLGKELYPYVIVGTAKNRNLLSRIGQPYVTLDKLKGFLAKIDEFADGIIVSCPKDRVGLRKSLEIVKEFR